MELEVGTSLRNKSEACLLAQNLKINKRHGGRNVTQAEFVVLVIKLLGQSQQCLEQSSPPHDYRLYDGSVSLNAITREIRIGAAPAIGLRDLVKELEIKNNNG